MREWNRSTRQLPLESISASMRNIIQEHLEYYNLGPILDDYLICVETESSKKKKGLFGGSVMGIKVPQHVIQTVILTPSWLVICTHSEKPESTAALSVPLKNANVEDYHDTQDYELIQDTGVYINGIFTGRVGTQGNQYTRYFIGLGEENAARAFKDILFDRIQKTRVMRETADE